MSEAPIKTPTQAAGWDLTPRQRDCLRVIYRLTAQFGRAPSFREVAEAMDLAGPNAVCVHTKRLLLKGYLVEERGPSDRVTTRGKAVGRVRGLRVVGVRWVPEFTPDAAGERARRELEDQP